MQRRLRRRRSEEEECILVEAAHTRPSYLSFQTRGRRDHGCRASSHSSYRSATGDLPARLSGRVDRTTGHAFPGRALLPHDARDRVSVSRTRLLESRRRQLLRDDSEDRRTGDGLDPGPDSPPRARPLQRLGCPPPTIGSLRTPPRSRAVSRHGRSRQKPVSPAGSPSSR